MIKFRSYFLVIFGILFQFVYGLIFYLKAGKSGIFGIVFASIAILMMISSLIGLVPLIFLIFKKTLIIGSILSIIFAIICFALRVAWPLGIFLLVAGIIGLWKKI